MDRETYLHRYLGRAAFSFKGELEAAFAEAGYGVTAPQWALLHALKRADGVPQKDLARRTFKDKTNVARILASLEERELIQRRRNEEDQRFYRVLLTPQGERVEKELRQIASGTLDRALEGIPGDQLQATMNTLKQIYHNLSSPEKHS